MSLALAAALAGAACTSDGTPTPVGASLPPAPSAMASSPVGQSAAPPVPAPTALAPSAQTPQSGSPSSSPAVAQPARSTTADRIIEARDAGEIDAATALLYRVYAVFGDARLPARFAGGEWSDDEAALGAAVEQLDSLPPEITVELRPYLVRPTDPSSVFFGPPDPTGRGPLAGPAMAMAGSHRLAGLPDVVCPGPWGYADGEGAFRVWGRCGGTTQEQAERAARIEQVAIWMEQIWADEVAYMGRAPQPDEGTVDHGGDPRLGPADPGRTRIDIYVTPGSIRRDGGDSSPGRYAVAFPSGPFRGTGPSTSSGYIVLNTELLVNPAFAKATLAHELFHVIQNAFNRSGVRTSDSSYWFVESSAVWAQWRFAPEGSAVPHEAMTPGRFEGFQASLRPLTDAYLTTNRYWSWAWPLFMDQESPGAVASAWRSITGKVGDEATTRAVGSVLRFETRFRDFAVRAHNKALTPTRDTALTKLFPEQAVGTPRVPPGDGRMDDEVQLHAELPDVNAYSRSEFILSLYAVYRPFKVDDDVGKVVFDFSGLAPQAAIDVDAIVRIKGTGWERRKLSVQHTFCRDTAADRVEEIVIVISNHDPDRNARVVGTWTAESLQTGCAAITGVLTVERTSSYLQPDPRLPFERRDEQLTATIVVNMRPDPTAGGYTDAFDPADAEGSQGSALTILRTFSAQKQMGDCMSSYSTKSAGTWRIRDRPVGIDWENGITGFVDRPSGIAGFSVVMHYPYEVVENICTVDVPLDDAVHDAFVCLDAKLVEVDGGPDRIDVRCESTVPDIGFSQTRMTIEGTLTLADE